ncbi:MAG: ABC transporter permease [Ferruginibacter sp.]
MLKNYFKIAWRNLFKHKVLSVINIAGLALGMAGAVLLIMNIQYEASVDQFHAKKDHIYKVYNKLVVNGRMEAWNVTSASMAPALKKDYPEIKEAIRVAGTGKLLSYGDKKLDVGGNYVDPAFLGMFSFPLVKGSAETSLKDIHSIVITEELAKKIFGDEDPMNKIIRADNADNFTVTGILKDLPYNTEFRFEYLLPWDFLKSKGVEYPSWDNNYLTTYAELFPTADITALNNKVADVILRNTDKDQKAKAFLYPFTQEHLRNHFENGKAVGGRINNQYMLGVLALIILLIACINFMNLSTAHSEKRAKEVGVRKVMGAFKRALVAQFISESILLSFIAGILAFIVVQLLVPAFSSLAHVHLMIPYSSVVFWLLAIGFILFTGILAGSYPAFYLSSFKPVKVLKGVLKNGNALVTPRKVLVVFQFVLSIFLINFTILFQKQIDHTQNREIGYVKENLIFHPATQDLQKNYALVKNELLSSGTATAVCQSSTTVTRERGSISGLKWEGMDEKANVAFGLLNTNADFIKTNGLKLLAGRDIDIAAYPTDTTGCVINESAVKVMGFTDPVGKTIKDEDVNWKIVGVVKDFLIGPADQQMEPVLIRGSNENNFINIRLNSNNPPLQNLQSATAILRKYNPNYLTEYQFADADYAFKFKEAKSAATLINGFAFIAIFISCMGLFGLSVYMAANRKKEIGIRKVLGSSIAGVTTLLAKDFVKLVVIAICIASPLAWLFMNSFLQHFSYRTNISGWIFFATGFIAIFIALITVSFEAIKAAVANPVNGLRME